MWFIEEFCRLPKGRDAGRPIVLRPWQVDIARRLFDEPRPRQGVVALPRKNGKSLLAACFGLWGLLGDEVQGDGREVVVVASDERQAAIVFHLARRMVELDPRLNGVVKQYQSRLVHPASDSVLEFLPADGDRLQGRNPTLAIVDELHVVREETWDAMALAGGTRPKPLVVGITTAGADLDGVCWRLIEHGRSGTDPGFAFIEYAAPDGCELDDEAAWALANPALGDFLDPDHLRATMRTTRESTFRRYHLDQWVTGAGAWLAPAAWAECIDASRVVADGDEVVLAFDGSYSGDSTALVGCTTGPSPHLFVVECWENPSEPSWRVPRAAVDAAVASAFDRFTVRRMACDPFGWRSEIEGWEATYGEGVVVEWPSNALPRIGPACDRFYQAVMEHTVSHDGDGRLARHMAHAHTKVTTYGDVLTKDQRGSPRKIDLAVAAVMALDVSATLPPARRRTARVMAF